MTFPGGIWDIESIKRIDDAVSRTIAAPNILATGSGASGSAAASSAGLSPGEDMEAQQHGGDRGQIMAKGIRRRLPTTLLPSMLTYSDVS
ncbi:MAG: hypothetical protein ACKPKO_21850, partial [Candidatus Fonsibacter sp.]